MITSTSTRFFPTDFCHATCLLPLAHPSKPAPGGARHAASRRRVDHPGESCGGSNYYGFTTAVGQSVHCRCAGLVFGNHCTAWLHAQVSFEALEMHVPTKTTSMMETFTHNNYYAYTCTHTHTHTHMHTHAHTHAHAYAHTLTCTHTRTHTRTHARTHARTHTL